MKFILFFFISIAPVYSLAQSVINLDIKNGFRNFKFGTSPSQYHSIKKLSKTKESITNYEYLGKGITIANISVQYIILTFFKNKLAQIYISFTDSYRGQSFSDDDYKAVVGTLRQAFGNQVIKVEPDEKIIQGLIWDGSKVRLAIIQSDGITDKNYTNSNIMVVDSSKMATIEEEKIGKWQPAKWGDPIDYFAKYNFPIGHIVIYDKKLKHQIALNNF